MKAIKKFLKEALFPQSFTCDACGIETFGNNLCPDCLKELKYNNGNTCPVCGRKTVRKEICIECKAVVPYFDQAVSPLLYDGTAIRLIHKFKNGDAYLKDYFADLIFDKVKNFRKFDFITYVPMTKKAERKRGYNQAKLLAESVGERLNVPVIQTVIKVKDTAEQKTLSRKERMINLADTFKVKTDFDLKFKNILLVDDVLTTGSTADAICKKLVVTGTNFIYFATIASVEYSPEKN